MVTLSKRHGLSLFYLSHYLFCFSVTGFGPSPLQWVLRLLCGLASARWPALILEVFTFTSYFFRQVYGIFIDFFINGGTTTSVQVIQNWENIMGNVSTLSTGFIVLEHDLWQQTVQIAVGYILPDALAFQPKLTIEPIIQCIHQPMSNAYIETNDNSSNPPLISGQY